MKIAINARERAFAAELQWAVVQIDTGTLIAASFAELSTGARAIYASLANGYPPRLLLDDSQVKYLYGEKGGCYRKVEQAIGPLTHMVVLHKAAVFQEYHESPVVLAFDGDLKAAVGKYLAARFTLPRIWEREYFNMLGPDCWAPLMVYVSSYTPQYRNLKAVRLSSKVTEEFMLSLVAERLKKGRLALPEVPKGPQGRFVPGWDMKTYLKENAAALAEKISEVRPRHDPARDKVDPAIAEMGRIPFPAQAHMIMGLVKALKAQGSAFCCGDMGTGKTLVALGVAHVLHRQKGRGMRVLLAAPGVTLPKWVNEIRIALPGAKVTVINSTEEALRHVRELNAGPPQGLEFTVVGTDRAKLGPEPWTAAVWRRVRGAKYFAWHCPDCLEALYDPKDPDKNPLDWEALADGKEPEAVPGPKTTNGLPQGFKVKWKARPAVRECPECGAKLRRPALKSRGETPNRPRWYVCRILRRARFDLFIQDEVHQSKAQDSGRGDSFAQLVKASDKTLALTGTLVNGLSTSIKEILWRTDPKALLAEGFDHRTGMVAWASRYGTLTRITRVEDVDTGVVTRQKRVQLQPKEEPGIAPEMTAHFLLHKAGFMELGDLGLPLVELKEIPVFLEMDEEHGREYRALHGRLKDKCRGAALAGFSGAWSKFIPATINYADRPDLGAAVEVGNEVIKAPALPQDYYHAKERYLVELIEKELAENRGVIVYANYTDSYGVDGRLKEVLEAHGIEAHVLSSGVSQEKRVDWLARKAEEGAKVLVCNMRLVEVGLDLIDWPTIIFYQASYDINTVRQAGRRAWRIGQDRECRVYYLVYDGTQQVAQFEKIMVKRGHAMLVEGRLDRSELARFARDAHSALAADLADCLASADLGLKWQELARKDMDANLRLVAEKDFKEAVRAAQKKLVAETLRLCGKDASVTFVETGSGLPVAQVKIVVSQGGGRGRRAVAAGQLAFDFFAS